MANFIMYGYKGDEDMASFSVPAVIRLLKDGETLIFIDDVFDPVSEEFAKKFKSEYGNKIFFDRTYHPRHGNLTGPDHTIVNFKKLHQWIDKDETVVKVDCDTMIFSRKWLDDFIADDKYILAGGFHSQHNYMFGLCYAVKSAAITYLEASLECDPPWIHCFEDFEVSSRINRWKPEAIKRYDLTKPRNSRWVCLPPNEVPNGSPVDVMDVNRTPDRRLVLKTMEDTLKQALAIDERKREKQNDQVNDEEPRQVGA